MTTRFDFASALLSWFDEHGRKNLPWQQPIEPYRVWLSEVMLQQTQVDTVIPYFHRFTERFPDVTGLAAGHLDEVLHLWTGLGYYARARNLHACAQRVVDEFAGQFPSEIEQLQSLPGIGRSTACAIASIAFDKPTAILDGNVKRVLSRFHAVPEWPGLPRVEKSLWEYAQKHMPDQRCGDYTQAIMDLGATLCRRSKPDCPSCPMRGHCCAYKANEVGKYPAKKPRKTTPTKATVMLIAKDNNRILLEKRPPQGIWGGLWSFPEYDDQKAALAVTEQLGNLHRHETWSVVTHVFSHYRLEITPLVAEVNAHPAVAQSQCEWFTLDSALNLGLAAPVKRLILSVQQVSNALL